MNVNTWIKDLNSQPQEQLLMSSHVIVSSFPSSLLQTVCIVTTSSQKWVLVRHDKTTRIFPFKKIHIPIQDSVKWLVFQNVQDLFDAQLKESVAKKKCHSRYEW